MTRLLKTGLAVGGGTGPELADVFSKACREGGRRFGLDVEILPSPRTYRTYVPVATMPAPDAARAAAEDADHYAAFVRGLAADGVRCCFRTAFNAQALYRVREELLGVKIEPLPHAGGELLLIRDQAQGFYGGDNDEPSSDPSRLIRNTVFSRAVTWRVLDCALEVAARRWGGPSRIDRIVAACKFHLLDSRFATWIRDYEAARGCRIQLYQPDTVNRHLARGLFDGRTLLVGSNEWADIMHAELVARFGHGVQEEQCTANVYLHPDAEGFTEYQTVHGSADDIAGRGLVNPAGTLRAAARLLEEQGGAAGAVNAMERALRSAARRGMATPDAGGDRSTTDVAGAVLAAFDPGGGADRDDGDLLVVVDLQNDFLAPDGRFATEGLVDGSQAAAFAERVNRLLTVWRASGRPVAFARTLADEARLPATVRDRNRRLGRGGWLKADSAGADFFGVRPRPGEAILSKTGYDPFLEPAFEAHLRRLAPRRLILAGAFTDVCIDAMARTAYQKGYAVTVVSDATLSLKRPQADALDFMKSFYDADILETDNLIGRGA